MKKAVLRINDLNKTDRDRGKLEHVSLVVLEGELISLVGMDYSGKDLLAAILSGRVKMDFEDTDIYLSGKRVRDRKDLQAAVFCSARLGNTIDGWTVSEYVILNELGWVLRKDVILPKEKKLQELIDRLGFQIDCRRKMGSLSEIQSRQADFVKAVWQKAKILIIEDEFSGMTGPAIMQLGESLRKAAKDRMTVIVNSHSAIASYYLGERYLIFRKGALVWKGSRNDIRTQSQFDDFLLGRTMTARTHALTSLESDRENVYAKRGIYVFGINGLKLPGLRTMNPGFYSGRVTTFLIPDHTTRHRLYHLLTGREIQEGCQYMFRENAFFPRSAQDFFDRRIVSVNNIGYPHHDSLMDNMTVADNLLLPSLPKLSFSEYLLQKDSLRNAVFREMTSGDDSSSLSGASGLRMPVRDADIHERISILLDRWLIFRPNVIIFLDPFLHCDKYGVALVQSYIRKFAGKGSAVVLIQSRAEFSEEITDEVIDVADLAI